MTANRAIRDAFAAARLAVDPERAVRETLNQTSSESVRHIWCIAVGKASSPMLAGAISATDAQISGGFLITKDDHIDREFDDRFVLREASHPVLDERTLAATGELLNWVKAIPADDQVLVLLSGGGSALLERPVPGVALAEFQTMTRVLLNAGADIYQLNTVRSLVSQVKGGRLRAAIPARQVTTLALSDVLGNDPTVIASGPTVPSTRGANEALGVIDSLGVGDLIPASIRAVLNQSDRSSVITFPEDSYTIIADNQIAITAAAGSLRSSGFNVFEHAQIQAGEARDVAREWVSQLSTVPTDVGALVAGGELTVTVRGDGRGGRNTEFALAAALALHQHQITDWTIASLATDGQDAVTGFAGAIVDGQTVAMLHAAGIDPFAALASNDSATALSAIEATVSTGPTGTNVNDLYFAVRSRPA